MGRRKVTKKVLAWILLAAMITTGFGGETGINVVNAGNSGECANSLSVFENFITVDGTKLMDGDKELKFVSLNYPQATSDTPWESENAVKTIKAMGGNVTRSYTIPVYNGQNSATAYVTGVDNNGQLIFNEDALNNLDNLLAACNRHGIRLIIPLVDHWHWIGGMDGYVWLAGEADGMPSQSGFQEWAWKFYESETCMDYFKQMITHLLNRTNSVTGVKYMDDPAILCWETGNEIGNRSQDDKDEILSKWTNQVANHIRSIYGDKEIPYETETADPASIDDLEEEDKDSSIGEETEEPGETETPEETEEPGETEVPEEPGETEAPEETEEPGETEVPEEPGETEAPEETEEPGETETPEETEAPEGTETPEETGNPEKSEEVSGEIREDGMAMSSTVTEQIAQRKVISVIKETAETEEPEETKESEDTVEAESPEPAEDTVEAESPDTAEDTVGTESPEKIEKTKKAILPGTKAAVSETASETPVRRHLILDGRMSLSKNGSLAANNPCDILGAHYYEGNYAERCKNDTITAHNAGKPFILGEFGAKVEAQPCADVFQAGLENNTNGIMMWSLRAHKDGYGYYFHDEDGYWASYHWPGFVSGDYYGETEILRAIYAYAQIANGKASTYEEAKKIPIPAPETDEAPLLYADGEYHNSFKDGSVGDIKWRGVVGGAWYEIQRADGVVTENDNNDVWTTIADEKDRVYDSGRNWEDKAHDCIAGYHDETAIDGQTYSYRLRACNESGEGIWSNIVTVNSAKHVVVDDLDLIAVSSTDPNPAEIRNTYSSDHSANISYSSSSIVNRSATEGYIEYESIIPVKEVVVTAVSEPEEGSEPKIFVSSDGINYTQIDAVHEAGTKVYSAADVSDKGKYYYTRIYMAGQSKCKLDAVSITYYNDGASYIDGSDGAGVKTNVMIQDNTFGINADPYYTMKSPNLAAAGSVQGITADDDKAASILYKTGDDINAYRIVVYEKDGIKPAVEYSYDSVTWKAIDMLAGVQEGDYTRVTYGDLNSSDMARVIRISFPEGGRDKAILKSVEISSGKKTIPLSESAPANTFEDGEYYFGNDAMIQAAYTIGKEGNSVVYSKTFDRMDFSAYDCIYSWVKPDNSGNTLKLRLADADNRTWDSEAVVLNGTTGKMNKFLLGGGESFDFSKVTRFDFVISAKNDVSTASGEIALNGDNFYTGNYGVELVYTFDSTNSTVYVDSVYASSSTKADDFEGYSGSNALLRAAYQRNTSGGAFDMSLDAVHKSEGAYGARIDYSYNGTGYAGARKDMDLLNLAGYDGFMMYIESDGSGNQFKLQMTTELSTYNYTGYLSGTGPMTYYMPFKDIVEADWTGGTGHIDASQNLKTVEIYTNQEGSVTSGTFYVDDIKGANFVNDLEKLTRVDSDYAGGAEITSFPYTISGTAEYVDYISLLIGEKVFNIPVDSSGRWTYEINENSGIYNGENMELQAGFYYPNRAVIATAWSEAKTITINVEGNDAPVAESYDKVAWKWDFAADGTDGWTFDGFSPWVESGNLVAWSADGYDATFSYTVTGIPNGVYTLSNDIKVKSNMNNAQMALTDGTDEVRSLAIDTEDVLREDEFLGKKFRVTNNQVTVRYYVNAPVDANGATFAVGDIKLYFVEALNLIRNGDFSDTEGYEGGWPNYPVGWNVIPYTNTGAIKTEPAWFEADNNKVMIVETGTEFSLSQDVTISDGDAGTYQLSAVFDMEHNPATVEDLVMKITDAEGNVVKSVNPGSGICTLSDIVLAAGTYTVTISGTLSGDPTPDDGNGPVIYIDDVELLLTDFTAPGPGTEESFGENLVTNGDFTSQEEEWPNLPADWETGYTGGDGWSPIKGQDGVFVGYADNAYTFILKQNIPDIQAGMYQLAVDIVLLNEGYANAVTIGVNDTVKDVTAEVNAADYTKVKIDKAVITGGMASIVITGDFKGKGVKIDNVSLRRWKDTALDVETSLEVLRALIQQYENVQQGDYTEESWNTFTDALAAAKEAAAKENVTQAEIDSAKAALEAAYAGLKRAEHHEGLWFEILKNPETADGSYIYTGAAIKPEIRVYHGDELLQLKKDYTVAYKNNTNAGEAMVTVTGKGNFKGKDTAVFTIHKKNINDADITAADVYAILKANGTVVNPKVTVKFGRKTLKNNNDYKVIYPDFEKDADGKIAANDYQIIISTTAVKKKNGVDVDSANYTGSRIINYTVRENGTLLMSSARITLDKTKVDYAGDSTGKPQVTGVKIGSTMLTQDVDYTVTYDENWNRIGKAAVIVTAKEGTKYYGSKTVSYTVNGTKLAAKELQIEGIEAGGYDYTGEPVFISEEAADPAMRTLKVTRIKAGGRPIEGGTILVEGTDYTVSYKTGRKAGEHTNAGTVTVTITGINAYTGSVSRTFKIKPVDLAALGTKEAPAGLTFAAEETAKYNKTGAKPAITRLTYNGRPLVEKQDYTVTYQKNNTVTAGDTSAVMTIKGKGNFKGSYKHSYKVTAASAEDVYAAAADIVKPVKFNQVKTAVKVFETETGKVLKAGTDYEKTITYYSDPACTEASEITAENFAAAADIDQVIYAKVTMRGNYAGTGETPGVVTAAFRVYDKDLKMTNKKLEIKVDTTTDREGNPIVCDGSRAKNPYYTGADIEPKVTVTLKGSGGAADQVLTEGTDYAVAYSNNRNKGKATVTVTGTGNGYGGTKNLKFTIVSKDMKWYEEVSEKIASFFSNLFR